MSIGHVDSDYTSCLQLGNGALVPIVFVVEQRVGEVVVDPPDGLFDI